MNEKQEQAHFVKKEFPKYIQTELKKFNEPVN